jgi:hypothetical protein
LTRREFHYGEGFRWFFGIGGAVFAAVQSQVKELGDLIDIIVAHVRPRLASAALPQTIVAPLTIDDLVIVLVALSYVLFAFIAKGFFLFHRDRRRSFHAHLFDIPVL